MGRRIFITIGVLTSEIGVETSFLVHLVGPGDLNPRAQLISVSLNYDVRVVLTASAVPSFDRYRHPLHRPWPATKY